MTPIQIILIVALIILLRFFFVVLKSQIFKRIIFSVIFLIGIFAVVFPETTNWAANLVGVERGADLLTYLLVIVFYASFYFLYAKIDQLNIRQTEIIRQLAIQDAREPKED